MKVIEKKANALEAAGLIPYFFSDAVDKVGLHGFQTVADKMDSLYGYGGFSYPFDGYVDTDVGQYIADDDDPLDAFLVLQEGSYTLYVFPYAITALVTDDHQVIGRFD
jgi:hypothetical protein